MEILFWIWAIGTLLALATLRVTVEDYGWKKLVAGAVMYGLGIFACAIWPVWLVFFLLKRLVS